MTKNKLGKGQVGAQEQAAVVAGPWGSVPLKLWFRISYLY